MEEFANIVSTIGFPITISLFLLLRVEKKISELHSEVEDMIVEIKLMKEIVSSCKGRGKK